MSTALEVYDPTEHRAMSLFGTTDPDEAVAHASRHAKALARVIEEQRLYKPISGNKHILVEGWQTLGSQTGVFAVGVGDPEYVEIEGVGGFKATVRAIKDGETIGQATGYCMRDEPKWKNAPLHALSGMSQTRATSRALKGPLGFIVKLAGFESTPFEEMPDDGPTPTPKKTAPKKKLSTPEGEAAGKATADQLEKIANISKALDEGGVLSEVSLLAGLEAAYGVNIPQQLTVAQAGELIKRLLAKYKEAARGLDLQDQSAFVIPKSAAK